MSRIIAILCALLVSTFSSAQTPQQAAQKTAQDFYAWALNHQNSALPSITEMKTLSPLLSHHLITLIEQARVVEAQCIKQTPRDEKPPLFEGALLVGNYEGVDEVIVGNVKLTGSSAKVTSRFFMVDSRYPKAHSYRVYSWVDGLKLVKVDGDWVVADILRRENASLVLELKNYLKDNKYCSNPY